MSFKKIMSILLSIVMVVGLLAGCSNTVEAADTPAPSSEFERAVWYNFAKNKKVESAVTEKEFVDMLSAMIQKHNPESVNKFKKVAFIQKADNSKVPRYYAAILLLCAAEAMDCVALPDGTYPTLNTDNVNWNVFWQVDWNLTPGWSEDTFSEISQPMSAAWNEPMNHFHGGINFASSRLSLANGKPLLDVDSVKYMRLNDMLTYGEAAVAVLRLYESTPAAAVNIPEDEAAAKTAETILKTAEERRQTILNSPTDISYKGKAYYVSNNGNDNNNGRSAEKAWATISRVNKANLSAGDVVFFERGGTWRTETLQTQKGVTYSAYGEGVKPRLIGSPENGAGEEKWSLLEGTNNIWVYYKDMLDCGTIVLNDAIDTQKVIGFWNGKQYLEYKGQNASKEELLSAPVFDVKTQLKEDLTFFSHASSELPNTLPVYLDGAMSQHDGIPLTCKTKGKLYFRCDAGNPGKIYESIEFVTPWYVLNDPVAENCTLDNLYIGYGGIGVSVGNAGLTVQNCEMAWIGGRIISYSFEDHDGNPRGALRVGGAIGSHADKMTIRNNYIHEIYEEAALVEIFESQRDYTKDLIIENVIMSGNLIYHVGSGIGYFNWDMGRNPDMMFKNMVYEDNIVLFTGLNGWLSKITSCAFSVDGGANLQEGAVVRNNVFFASRDCLLYLNQYHKDTLADYEGNKYIQYKGYPYLLLNEEQRRYFADEAEYAVKELLRDKTGTITTLNSMKWDNLDW